MRCRIVWSLCIAGTLFAFRVSFAQGGPAVPVLCYHGFSGDTSAAQGKLTESYARFGEMLRFLKDEGYRTMFPEELLRDHARVEKAIIMTFDDGRKDQLKAAAMMREYGMRGIFFVVPSRIFGDSSKYLTSRDLALLTQWGHQIGVHGFAHQSMVESSGETENVRTLALKTVKEAVPSQSDFPNFAFPFGHYDTSSVALTSGYFRFLHTVNPGYWDGRSTLLPRLLVTADKPIVFLMDYVKRSSRFKPSLVRITPDGGIGNVVSFKVTGAVEPIDLSVMAVSADRDGYHYATHTVGDFVSGSGDSLFFDLRRYIERFYQEKRAVLSYAFVKSHDSSIFYVSSGQTHWVAR